MLKTNIKNTVEMQNESENKRKKLNVCNYKTKIYTIK